MKGKLIKLTKPLAGILGLLVLLSLLNKFIYGEQVRKRNRLKGEVQTLTSQIKGIEEERKSWVEELRRRKSHHRIEVRPFRDYSWLYSQLSGEGMATGIKLLEMNLARPKEDSLGKSYPFLLQLQGGYEDLLNHLQKLEETLPLISVKEIAMEIPPRGSSRLTMRMEGKINTLKPTEAGDHSPPPRGEEGPIRNPFATWRKGALRRGKVASRGWKLRGIVQRQNGQNIALINSHIVTVGDKVQGKRVEKIEKDAIFLTDSTKRLTVLKLKP